MNGGEVDVSVPLVSVVLPTHNRPNHLSEAISSVYGQSYPRIEIVVVDDCSNPPVNESLTHHSPKGFELKVVRHDSNLGANAARCTGIEQARGSLIAFLDDDDRWLPGKISKQVSVFEGRPEVVVVYTGQQYRDTSNRVTGIRTPSTRGNATVDILQGASVGPFSTLMVRKKTIDAVGPPDVRFPSLQDKEWVIRLSQQGVIEPVTEPLVIRQEHHGGNISDDFKRRRDVTYPLFLETYRPLARSHGSLVERRFIANIASSVAAAGVTTGNYKDASRFALHALRQYPLSRDAIIYLLLSLGGKYTYKPARAVKHLFHRIHNAAF